MSGPGLNSFHIREARREDFEAVGALRRVAFPLLLSLLMRVTMTRQALVAESAEGRIVGALTFKFVIVGATKLGVPEWAVVDPQHQGAGVGKALLRELLARFQTEGCEGVITTDVDGYNSPSWNMCRACGFSRWALRQQVREFRWRTPELWWKTPHLAPGAFLLRKDNAQGQAEPSGTGALGIATCLLGFFLLPLSLMREALWQGFDNVGLLAPLDPRMLLTGAAVVAVYMAARMVAHWLAARALKLPLAFRPWDAGLVMATVLAVLFGAFIPAFAGSVYVRQDRVNYVRVRPEMGKIMLAAVAVSLALLTACTFWVAKSGSTAYTVAALGRYVGVSFGITDTLFFFAPFQAVPAGHLWLWRRAVWLLVFVSFIVVWLLLPRLL